MQLDQQAQLLAFSIECCEYSDGSLVRTGQAPLTYACRRCLSADPGQMSGVKVSISSGVMIHARGWSILLGSMSCRVSVDDFEALFLERRDRRHLEEDSPRLAIDCSCEWLL